MQTTSDQLADRYLVALRTHLAQGPQGSLAQAGRLGRQAMRLGLGALDLAEIHDVSLVALMSPEHPSGDGDGTIGRAGRFFRQALTRLVDGSLAAGQTNAQTNAQTALAKAPRQRTAGQLHRRWERETARRKAAETALKENKQHYDRLLAESRLMQKRLRSLSHQILLVQEEERKRISRELHDEISQVLTGINVRLAALKIEATRNTGNITKKISYTQRLVAKSVANVHAFARQLRPAMLDDLGLIPSLQSYMKDLSKRTGLRIQFSTPTTAKIEQLDSFSRTALYRVAQEALTNVVRHAKATEVQVSIRLQSGVVSMEVGDNGKSFVVDDVLRSRRRNCLGIIGMRERTEMLGGTLAIESAAGKGTTVHMRLPIPNGTR